MSYKNYYGLCGSCRYCELGDSYTSCYVTHFKCLLMCDKEAIEV